MPAVPLSVIIITRNEAANIEACLQSVAPFDDIIVVDSHSTDGTQAIARSRGARIVDFLWNGAYPKKKQWALDNAAPRHDWVLLLDADERLTTALQEEIAALIAGEPSHEPLHAGYFIVAANSFAGKRMRFGLRNCKLSLFNRHYTRFPIIDDLDCPRMGEVEGHYQPNVQGSVGRLRAGMVHEDCKGPLDWLDRHRRYAEWEARLRADGRDAALWSGERAPRRWAKQLLARLPGRPFWVFCHSYLWRLGFLDGRAGFSFALARAHYYWQVGLLSRYFRARKRDNEAPDNRAETIAAE